MQKYYPDKNGLILLLRDLGSKDDDIRYQAYLEAQSLSADQLLMLANAEAKQYERYQGRRSAGCLGSVIATVLLFIPLSLLFLLALCVGSGLGVFVSLASFALLAGVGMICLSTDNNRIVRTRRTMTLLIRNCEDVRFTATALQMWARAIESRKGASYALQKLLPKLRESDVAGWPREHKAALLEPLRYWAWDVDLTLCVLKTLEQIGDVNAVESVRRLAYISPRDMALEPPMYDQEALAEALKRGERGEQARLRLRDHIAFVEENSQKIRQAAVECLEILEVRLNAKNQGQTLLRAADMVATPETLLRPASREATEIPAEQLLRAADRVKE